MLVPVETEISRPASQPNLKWSWQLPLHSFFLPSGVCYLSWRPHFLSSVPGKTAKKPPLSCVLLPNYIQIWLSRYFCFNVFFPIKSNNKLVEIFLGGKVMSDQNMMVGFGSLPHVIFSSMLPINSACSSRTANYVPSTLLPHSLLLEANCFPFYFLL